MEILVSILQFLNGGCGKLYHKKDAIATADLSVCTVMRCGNSNKQKQADCKDQPRIKRLLWTVLSSEVARSQSCSFL